MVGGPRISETWPKYWPMGASVPSTDIEKRVASTVLCHEWHRFPAVGGY